MTDPENVESRLQHLEREVAELRRRLDNIEAPKRHWLEDSVGCMADFPEWEEVVRLGREIRAAERPPPDDDQTGAKTSAPPSA